MSSEPPKKKFCCCFTLRTGGIVVGGFNIGFCIGGIIRHLFGQSHSNYAEEFLWDDITRVIAIAVFAIYLYGVFSKRELFMLPGMVLHIIGVLGLTFVVGFDALSGGGSRFFKGSAETFITVMVIFITIFSWYLIVISCLLFCEIRNSNAHTRYDHGGAVYRPTTDPINAEAGTVPLTSNEK